MKRIILVCLMLCNSLLFADSRMFLDQNGSSLLLLGDFSGGGSVTYPKGVLKGDGTTTLAACTGATNKLARWETTGSIVGSDIIYDDGTNIGIGTEPVTNVKLYVSGTLETSGKLNFGYMEQVNENNCYFRGYLGLGNSNPQAPLDVIGNAIVSGTVNASNIKEIEQGNTLLGVSAGNEHITGSHNIATGYQAGYLTTSGSYNVFTGYQAGYNSGDTYNNIFIGYMAGFSNTSSVSNVFTGFQAGYSNLEGGVNVFSGYQAGYSNDYGNSNVFIGEFAGYNYRNGNQNICIGLQSGIYLYDDVTPKTTGDSCIYLGARTKSAIDGAENEIVIGYNAVGNGSNTIVIGSDSISTTTLKGNVGIGTTSPQYTLEVNGSVAGIGAYNALSDTRFKKDVKPITGALEKIKALSGITFNWNKNINKNLKFDDLNHIGFLAQDVEKVIPQVVFTAKDEMKTKSVAYSDIIPVLVEAIKEQQKQIEELKKLINKQ
jgi:hypothetical protein